MVNLSLVQALQMTVSERALKSEIIKEIIYRASTLLSTGTKILPEKRISKLDGIMTYPSEMGEVEEIAEGVEGDLDRIVWTEFGWTLKKYRKAFLLTDESKYRGIQNMQNVTSIRRVAEAFAKKQDAEIIDAIIAAAPAGNTVTITAGAEWDKSSATTDIVHNIIEARGNILHNSNVLMEEIKSLGLLVGTNVSSYLLELNMINNVTQTIEQYLKSAYGIIMYESRDADLADDSFLIVPGERTGRHLVFDIPEANLVEQGRVMGVGEKYMVTKYFQTKIEPESKSVATNNRIAKITNTAQ